MRKNLKNLELLGLRVITSNKLVREHHQSHVSNAIVELINKTNYKCDIYPNASADAVGICLEVPQGKNEVAILRGLNEQKDSMYDKLVFTTNGIFTKSRELAGNLIEMGFRYIPEKSAIVTVNT